MTIAPSEADGGQSKVAQLLEFVGGMAIALAAAFCSGIAHVRTSPIALATIGVCGCILLPFVCLACVMVTIGFACCIPLVLIGIACASVPVLVRRLRIAAGLANSKMSVVSEFVQDNPLLVTGAGLMLLPLSPVLLIGGAFGAIGYFFFAPVTIPMTLLVLWRFLPAEEHAADEATATTRGGAAAAPSGANSTPRSAFGADPRSFFAAAVPAGTPANTPQWPANTPQWPYTQPPPADSCAYARTYAYAPPAAACCAPPPAVAVAAPAMAPATAAAAAVTPAAVPKAVPAQLPPSSMQTHASASTLPPSETPCTESAPAEEKALYIRHGPNFDFSLPAHLCESAAAAAAPGRAAAAAARAYEDAMRRAAASRPPTAPHTSTAGSSPAMLPPHAPVCGSAANAPTPPLVPLAVPLVPPGADASMSVDAAFLAAATRALAACKAADFRGEILRGEGSIASSA